MATHWPRLFYREREHARSKERMADRELNDSVLCDISWELGTQWTYLAVILGFRSSEIEAIETDSLGDSARSSLHMLVTWKNRQPPSVDMSRNLGDALLKIGRADIACRLNLLQRPAVNSTLEEISKHHPQCFVCMERFKKPMELECLHSFCERCLAGLSKDKGCTQIPCPLCRHTTPFSGFESLKPNFQLRSLVEEIEKGLSAYDDSSEATEPQVTVTSQKSNDSREEVRRGENTTDAKHRKEMGKLLDQQETKSVSGGEVGPTVQDMDAKDIVRKVLSNDDVLLEIVKRLGPKWKELATFLEISIEEVTTEGIQPSEQALRMLKRWNSLQGRNVDHFGKLCDALANIGSADIVTSLLHHAELHQEVLDVTSEELGPEWKKLALMLGFSASEINETMKENNGDDATHCLAMLKKWKERVDMTKDQLGCLSDALTDVGKKDLVLQLRLYRVVIDIASDKWHDIASFIGEDDWVRLAGVLGLSSEEFNTIKTDTTGDWKAQCCSMLVKWHHHQGKNEDQCMEALCAALSDIGRKGLAMRLQQHYQDLAQTRESTRKTVVAVNAGLGAIAGRLQRADWEKLGLVLGLSKEDIGLIKELYPHIYPHELRVSSLHHLGLSWEDQSYFFQKSACYSMLLVWKHRQSMSAPEMLEKLGEALNEIGKHHLAILLPLRPVLSNDDVLLWIVRRLGPRWKELATSLGISSEEVTTTEGVQPGDQAFRILKKWDNLQGRNVYKFGKLCDSLENIGRADLITPVLHHAELPHEVLDWTAQELTTDWKKLALMLGFSASEINKVMKENGDGTTHSLVMIKKWKDRIDMTKDQLGHLCDALTDLGMEDLVLGLQQYRVVSKDKWRDISTFIGEHDWVSLAGVLGFNSEEINTIKADTPGNWRALCYSMLDKWHHRQDKNEDQCIKKLCAALTDIGRKGLAILLQQHFQGIGQAKKCNPKTAVTIDECLNNVARDIGRSDWEKLAFHLGLSGEDVALIRELHCHEWQDPNLYSIRPWLHRPPYAWEDEWLDFRHPKFQYPCLHMLHIWKHRQVVSEDEILAKLCDALSRMGRDNLAHQWRHRHVEIPEDQLQERLDTDAMAQEPKSEHPEDSIMRLCVGAFGTVGSQSSSAAVEILGCLDTDEAKEKMFKYCQEKCLRMFDFTEKEIKMDSQEDCDLQVIVQNVGDGWMLQNCAPQHMQTMSTAELREGLFEKGQLQFAKKSDSKGDMAPARDVLSCEIIIKSLDRSMESAEDNKLQLSVNLKPAYGSNPEAVKVPLEDTPSQPTDLESALLTYQELAKEFGEEYMKENTFQLPYFAIGQFNENGGRLSLDSYSVQLYIPHGALPTGSKQQVYIYVNPNGSCDEGSDSEDSISPVVQCGPPGLKFLESVVLTLPINDVEDFKTKPSAQICEEKKDATPGDWQSLEGAFVASVENKATLLVDHFSKYRVVAGSPGYTSKKIYIGASSDYYESNGCCNVQVCLFNRKPRDSDVFFFEKKPTEAGLVLIQGDVHVRVKEVSDGYEFQPTDPKVFGRSQVWKLYKNSATVYLIRKISGYGVPTCVVNCSQKNNNENAPWKGFDVDLWVKPYPEPVSSKADKSVQHVPHLKRTLSAKVIDSVQQEPSLKEKMKSSVAKTVQGDNGGLSKTAFDELCSLLEAPQEGDSHWIRFTLSFFGTSTSLVEKAKRNPSPARVVLNAYFALKTKEEDAVTSLVRDFERLGFGDEVREVTQRGSTVPGNNNRYCQRDLQGRIPHASSCGGTKTSHTILMTSQCVQDEAGSAQHTVDQGTSNGISTQDMEVDYTDQEIILDHFKNLSLQ